MQAKALVGLSLFNYLTNFSCTIHSINITNAIQPPYSDK